MNRRPTAAIALLLSILSGGRASAQAQTVLEFLNGSDLSSLSNQDQFAAQNYVTGVVDSGLGAGTIATGTSNGRAQTCLPAHTTQALLYGLVMQYIGGHADALQFPAAADVNVAISQAFPCAN